MEILVDGVSDERGHRPVLGMSSVFQKPVGRLVQLDLGAYHGRFLVTDVMTPW